MREGEEKIVEVLLYNANGLSFTELKEKTGLSPPSLSENLRRLSNLGFLLKIDETRKYRLRKGVSFQIKDNSKIEEKLMHVVGLSTALLMHSLGYRTHERLEFNFKQKTKSKLNDVVKKDIDHYNSLILYTIWEILLFSQKNGDSGKINEYIEDYFQPMLYIMNEYIKNNDDLLDLFDNSIVPIRNNIDKLQY